MNKIFDFLDYNSLYERCIMASIAHAIMVGKYSLLACEQSWDGNNYNFQNMEGIRGVISFGKKVYVCTIQNGVDCDGYNEHHVSELFNGAEEEIVQLAEKEALQYMLDDFGEGSVVFISIAFWGNEEANFSNQSEAEMIEHSEKIIMPFLYSENDAKKYWKNYYEMNDEQSAMLEDIYERRIRVKGRLNLTENDRNKLERWFGDINECIESFKELNIII